MQDTKRLLPPPRLARLVERARDLLTRFHRDSVPAPVAMLEILTAGWLSQAVCVAAKLGIADVLAKGPASAAEIARSIGADADATQRLLRALAQHGVFRWRPDGRFAQSALSESLRREGALSVRNFALYVGSAEQRAHWSQLECSIREGTPCVAPLRGMPFFEYTRHTPAFGTLFNDAMTSIADLACVAVLASYDFTRFTEIVDVGGGHGRLLGSILTHTPAARGVLFDLPEVTAGAAPLLTKLGVLERCAVESGSFMTSVPKGGDAYVLKHIVHDWPDELALAILRNVRAAIADHGTLLLIEGVIPEGATPHVSKLTDLEMLLSLGGRERTRDEFSLLLERAGFSLTRVVETASPISIVEARPRCA